MSEPDAVPLPREGEVFFDVRGDARALRLSWYADTQVAVFSIWQGNRCTGTFRLPFGDLSRMVQALQSGPHPREHGRDAVMGALDVPGAPPFSPDGRHGGSSAGDAGYLGQGYVPALATIGHDAPVPAMVGYDPPDYADRGGQDAGGYAVAAGHGPGGYRADGYGRDDRGAAAHGPGAYASGASDRQEPAYRDPAYAGMPYAAPAYQEPAYQEPAYQEPAYQEPAYQEPAYAVRAFAAPAYQEPAYASTGRSHYADSPPRRPGPQGQEPESDTNALGFPSVPARNGPAGNGPAGNGPAGNGPAQWEAATMYYPGP